MVAGADVRDEEHEVAVEVERPVLAMSVVEAALALRHAGLALGRERVALLKVEVGLQQLEIPERVHKPRVLRRPTVLVEERAELFFEQRDGDDVVHVQEAVEPCSWLLVALLVAPILAGRLAGLAASHDNGVA